MQAIEIQALIDEKEEIHVKLESTLGCRSLQFQSYALDACNLERRVERVLASATQDTG